jgi:monofunctional biosynthetic peptidoglycan transglycosylase
LRQGSELAVFATEPGYNAGAMSAASTTPVRRLLRVLAIAVIVVLALPYAVAPLYRVINPVSMPMLWRWATRKPVERSFVALGQISPALPITVVGAEDGSFCSNRGIDLGAMRQAIEQSDDELAVSRGASTITQQVAKNLFLWSGRSFVRKALELPLALWLNMVLPKRRILEIYLNIAEWGPNGQFGAEAGARYAFGHPARTLNAREAAEMAAILPNPIERSARSPGALVRRLAGIYERRAATYPRLDRCIRPQLPRLARSIAGQADGTMRAADSLIPHFALESAQRFFYKRANPQ